MQQTDPSRSKIYAVMLSTIFCLLLLGGMAGAFVPYDTVPALRELRALASFPSLKDIQQPTRVPGQITSFFADNFGGRKLLVREYFRLRLRGLGADVGLPVVIGKTGWLISTSEIASYRHDPELWPALRDKIHTVLESWCIYARERGAHLVLAVGPNKSTIYPEEVPDHFPVWNGPATMDMLHSLPFQCPVIKVDLRKVLRENAADELYYKWGTHWNNRAGVLAWREIKRTVAQVDPSLVWPDSGLRMEPRPATPQEDSMWQWFGLQDPNQETMVVPWFEDAKYAAGQRARILAFGDSFLLYMEPTARAVMGAYRLWAMSPQDKFEFKPEDLGKDGWIIPAHAHQKRIELMDAFRPNIVVLEVVERGIGEIASFPLPPKP